ncbi:MAG: hypothetical protein ACFFEN_00720 [Candidatus Thorarchaeota archaeon]
MEGDGEADVLISLIEDCGIGYEDYAKDKTVLTREILERHFDELLETVSSIKLHVAFLILGVLILNTGSKMPVDPREKLIVSAYWQND